MRIIGASLSGLVLALTWSALAWAEPEDGEPLATTPGGVVSVQVENDTFTGGDRYYTSGLAVAYASAKRVPDGMLFPLTPLGRRFLHSDGDIRWGITLGQNIYTPTDKRRTTWDSRDRPYAGWLYLAPSLTSYTDKQSNTLELQVGIVGPAAQGSSIQNGFHKLVGYSRARGWHNQLGDELGVVGIAERKWRARTMLSLPSDIAIDYTPHVALALGNVQTSATAGLGLRIGRDLASDFGPPRIRPSMTGAGFFRPSNNLGWNLFANFDVRAVGHDIFLDGNSYGNGPSVKKRMMVEESQVGAALTYKTVRLTYTYVSRSEEFVGQRGGTSFGAFSLSVAR